MMAHLDSAAAPPSSLVPVPAALDAIVLKAMARDPNQRFQTSADMAGALAGLRLGGADLAGLATLAKDRRAEVEARDEVKTAAAGHATLVGAGLRPDNALPEDVRSRTIIRSSPMPPMPSRTPVTPFPPVAAPQFPQLAAPQTPPVALPQNPGSIAPPPPPPTAYTVPSPAPYAVAAPTPYAVPKPAPGGTPALIAQTGVEGGTRFSLPPPGKSATIGRASTNDIPLSSAKLSRVQARIDCDVNGQYFIVDLNSLNGTQVNGIAAREPIRLKQGDAVVVGDVTLFVDLEAGAEPN
jgi:hypothetical protein